MFKHMPRRSLGPRPTGFTRRGAVTLEFIVALPVLVIVLLAVIEFGMLIAHTQQLTLASRAGAEVASQTDLSAVTAIPPAVLQAINSQLSSSGVTPCRIILEHNVPGTSPTTLSDPVAPSCPCVPPTAPLPVIAARSVRVTVCAPMSELAPNCLALFGFNLTGHHTQSSTTFRYEL